MKNEILLTGNISESEIDHLNKELSEIKVIKAQTKGLSKSEFIQLVFHNFEVLTFTRDFILSIALTNSIKQINKIIQYFQKRNKKLQSVNIEIQIKTADKEFQLDIITKSTDDIGLILDLTNERMEIIINKADHNSRMEIIYGKNKSDTEINKV